MSAENLALVTGAAGGIGSEMIRTFELAGWETVAIDKHAADGVLQVDASDPEQGEALFDGISDSLNALINNAAVQMIKPLIDTSPEEWDSVLSANLRSVYLMSKYAHPHLKRGTGAIVNVSSVHAIATSESVAAYAASKGAVLALTRAMSLEFAPGGIRVNALLPGAVDTSMLRAGIKPDIDIDELAGRIPLGRIGQPHEIAHAALFLADNRSSSFITGQALVVDGGATTCLSTD